jgi:hypothetical protein
MAGPDVRLSALSSWYRYLAAPDVIAHHPVSGVVRPWVDPDHSETVGLDRFKIDSSPQGIDLGVNRMSGAGAIDMQSSGRDIATKNPRRER